MRLVKAVLIAILLTTWLTGSNHCYLEMMGVVGPDECHEAAAKSSPSQSDPCENDCKLVEKANYKIQDNEQAPVVVGLIPVIFQALPEGDDIPKLSVSIAAWPPETLHLPQFLTRTSLPVRAPSFAS